MLSQPKRKKRRTRRYGVVFFALLCAGAAFQLLRPLPEASIKLSLRVPQPIAQTTVDWPGENRAAFAAEGYGVIASHGSTEPLATASIAKVITALSVLEKHPLKLNESGPLIPVTVRDVAFYEQQVQKNGSRLPVKEGMQLSEYQALQALMVPSANNIADTLAIWAFGDTAAYASYANDFLQRHGLVQTRVGSDASGLDPSTTSTASDLAQLGLLARRNPVLMQIAAQKSVVFPYAGEYENYNRALGQAGINGLKTGNNEQNPGALLFTADVPAGETNIHISGSVMGAESLQAALDQSVTLVSSLGDDFEKVTVANKNEPVGMLGTAWGKQAPVRVKGELSVVRWKGHAIETRQTLAKTDGTQKQTLGAVALHTAETHTSSSLVLMEPAPEPSLWWRLTRLR